MKAPGLILLALLIIGLGIVLVGVWMKGSRRDEVQDPEGDVPRTLSWWK